MSALALEKLDSDKNPRAWIYRVVENLAANWKRKADRRERPRDGAGEREQEGRGVRAEDDLVGVGVQEVGRGPARGRRFATPASLFSTP